LPNKLEVQICEIIDNQVDLVFSKTYIFFNNNTNDNQVICSHSGLLLGNEGIKKLIDQNRIPILTVLVKRSAVQTVGGFSECQLISNAEDYHLWLKLIFSGFKFYGSNNILAYYRVFSNSSTGDDKLAIRILPFVYNDLSLNFPNYKLELIERLKKSLIDKNRHRIRNRNELFSAIRMNCNLLNKKALSFILIFFSFFLPIRTSIFIVNRLLNE
jgi:hypothetical protein